MKILTLILNDNKQEKYYVLSQTTPFCLIKDVCKKASRRPAVLSRLPSYLEPENRKLVFNTVIKSHFTYCLLVWVFCSRTSNNLIINKTYKCFLKIDTTILSGLFHLILKLHLCSVKEINRLLKEINSLLSKGMSNIY